MAVHVNVDPVFGNDTVCDIADISEVLRVAIFKAKATMY